MAWAQTPSFDANNRQVMDPKRWQNRLLVDGFEPGSVMKGVSLAGALDYGVVELGSRVFCEQGKWEYCRRILHDSGHKYGTLTVAQIVQKSSNIGTAKIALQMGETRLYQTFVRFGFGRPTGIGFPEEENGIMRAVNKWDGLSVTRLPIGQGILVTPLQMVQAYCSLANGGTMMQLYVVDRIENPDTGLCEVTVPRVVRRTVKPESARSMVQALKLVTTTEGTAPKAAVEGHEVAGKTGTAQKVIDGQYSYCKYVSSFIGFVPADNPAFTLLIVADEPQRAHYGGTVAAPTFSRIAERTLRYLQIAPAKPAPVPTPVGSPHDVEAVVAASPSLP
jgi:cell division protein FtsI/penicillin-binding protein 2